MKELLLRGWLKLGRRIGHAGMAGSVLLVAALALAASLPSLKRATQETVASMAARTQAAGGRLRAQPVAVSPAQAVRAYIDAFPPLGQNAADVAQIFAAAELRHLALPKGEYQLKAEPNAPFVTYTATFPMHGDYDSLKGFSADVLTALPHVAMDELRISRDSAGSSTLDAVVRFTFFYRSI